MADPTHAVLSILNASSVIFDKKWSTNLPIVGDVQRRAENPLHDTV